MLGLLEPDKDAAAVRVPPPLIFLAIIGIAVAIQFHVSPLTFGMSRALQFGLAAILALPCVVLLALALAAHLRTGQNPEPWKSTPTMLTGGVYAWTRNPMYLGMALGQAALGMLFDNGWILLLTPASMLCVFHLAIRLEEAYLLGKFGRAYEEYVSNVRRWL